VGRNGLSLTFLKLEMMRLILQISEKLDILCRQVRSKIRNDANFTGNSFSQRVWCPRCHYGLCFKTATL